MACPAASRVGRVEGVDTGERGKYCHSRAALTGKLVTLCEPCLLSHASRRPGLLGRADVPCPGGGVSGALSLHAAANPDPCVVHPPHRSSWSSRGLSPALSLLGLPLCVPMQRSFLPPRGCSLWKSPLLGLCCLVRGTALVSQSPCPCRNGQQAPRMGSRCPPA